MIACVIHGAKQLKIENRSEPCPQEGEVLVRFGAGGICGSDLHYYHEGGILDLKIREPLVLGHEVAGHQFNARKLASDYCVFRIQPGC